MSRNENVTRTWRYFRNTLLVLFAAFALSQFWHAYTTNNICSPDQKVLGTKEDAIQAVRNLIVSNKLLRSADYTIAKDALSENCCDVDRSRNMFFVVEWKVSTMAEKDRKRYFLNTVLSNCGAVFSDSTFRMVEDIR